LKGREVILMTVTRAFENSEWMEMDVQKPGPGNKGIRGIKTVDKWQSAAKS
jgi:hypothetical protein